MQASGVPPHRPPPNEVVRTLGALPRRRCSAAYLTTPHIANFERKTLTVLLRYSLSSCRTPHNTSSLASRDLCLPHLPGTHNDYDDLLALAAKTQSASWPPKRTCKTTRRCLAHQRIEDYQMRPHLQRTRRDLPKAAISAPVCPPSHPLWAGRHLKHSTWAQS